MRIGSRSEPPFLRYIWEVALGVPASGVGRLARAATLFAPALALSIARVFDQVSLWLALGWGLFVVGFINPFFYWRSTQIRLRAPLVAAELESSGMTDLGFYWCLRVENRSDQTLHGCHAYIAEGRALDLPGTSVPPGALQWSSRMTMSATTELDIPMRQGRVLDLAYLDVGHDGLGGAAPPPWPTRIVYAGGELARESHQLAPGFYLLLLTISAEDRSASYAVISLATDGTAESFSARLLHAGLSFSAARSAYENGPMGSSRLSTVRD
jgi:hypothetical protein